MNERMVSTGVSVLDEFIGGVPEGSIVLVAGHPGAGKTTLAAQFMLGLKNSTSIPVGSTTIFLFIQHFSRCFLLR